MWGAETFSDYLKGLKPMFGPTQAAADAMKNTITQGGFMDFLKNSFTGDNFKNLVDLGGLAGGLYSAINQQKMAKKNFNLQKDAYDFNKFLSNEELKRKNKAEQQLNSVWSSN